MIPEVQVFAQVVAISIGLIAAACGIGVATYRSVKRIDNPRSGICVCCKHANAPDAGHDFLD